MEVTKRRRSARLASKQRDREDEVPWSSISGDLLCLVAEKIKFIEDYVNFCAVCRRWYVIGTEFYNRKRKFDLDFISPFYMFGIDPSDPDDPFFEKSPINPNPSPNLRFRSFASERDFVVESPEAAGRRCWGSPFGWLVTFGADDLQFSLLNPFTRATIALPSMSTLISGFKYSSRWCFLKAILTADPLESRDDCFVFILVKAGALEDSRLAFARPGRDNVWSPVEGVADLDTDLSDVISFRGKLYGVSADCYPSAVVYSIQTQPFPRVLELVNKKLVPGDPDHAIPELAPERSLKAVYVYTGSLYQGRCITAFCFTRKYLVDLNGELCLVLRHIKGSGTIYFKVFKIDLSTRELARVWPLGDRCLFLGNHSTFAHETEGCMSNRVLYTYDDDWAFYNISRRPIQPDVGVWDMLGCDKVYSSAETLTRYPPLWMIPSISFTSLEELGRLRRSKVVSEVVETYRSVTRTQDLLAPGSSVSPIGQANAVPNSN